jgi:hypothetical protein
MLPTTLNTNEVKNSAGTEVQFVRRKQDGTLLEFAHDAEVYNAPHRLTISHSENGAAAKLRRRSVVRVDKTVPGVDGERVKISAYIVADIPVGNLDSNDEVEHVIAELLSFSATTGADTTVLFNGTGHGATCLIQGTL